MIPSLAPCFEGYLARFKDALALPGEHDTALAGEDLLDAATTERLLLAFAGSYPGGDRRAVISMWMQWHFGVVMIPTTLAILLLGRDLPVELGRVRIVAESGCTAAVILPDEGETFEPNASGRFARLFDGHVDPLIRHFARQFGASSRLLWSNAATTFEWTLKQAASSGRANPAALAEGHALLTYRMDPNGRPNPMHGALRYREEGGEMLPLRRICCLRYLLPGVPDCGRLCPVPAHGR